MSYTETCRAAIRKYWPAPLWEQAYTVLDHENGKENPRATLHNANGSYDRGCMQVNSIHLGAYGWTNVDDIYNPDTNARVAYGIYQARKVAQGNGWRAWYSVQGLFWK